MEIETLKSLLKQRKYKQITDLYNIKIRPEKAGNKLIINRIIYKDGMKTSLSAIVWEINKINNYKKYNVCIKTTKSEDYKTLTKKLLNALYAKVIKNKIMML